MYENLWPVIKSDIFNVSNLFTGFFINYVYCHNLSFFVINFEFTYLSFFLEKFKFIGVFVKF